MSFEPNQGQSNSKVKFLSRGIGYTVFFDADEAVLALQEGKGAIPPRAGKTHQSEEVALRMQFVDRNPTAELSARDELIGKSNYFVGNNPEKWRTGIAQFRQIEYRNIYPSVNLLFYGNPRKLEYDFVVNPGGNPELIRVRLRGADQIRLDGENLSVKAGQRYLRFTKPLIYQESESGRKHVEGHFVVFRDEFSFRVGKYDHSKPLIIDPAVVYSENLGGDNTSAASIAVTATGEVFLTGGTSNPSFPATAGAFQTTIGDTCSPTVACSGDAFVMKLDSTGNVVYATYLGGSDVDSANAISIDAQGDAYVAGQTYSTNFPVTSGAFQKTAPACASSRCGHVFVAALSPTGTGLIYASYLGGSGNDSANATAVDATGRIYITGVAGTPDFPTTPGALLTTFTTTGGISFVAKIDPLQSGIASLVYSTFLGGTDKSEAGQGNGIVVDAQGNAYVTGTTSSAKFPTTPGAFLTTLNQPATQTGYVAELNSSGSSIILGTYLGDTSGMPAVTCSDSPKAIAFDSSGIYVVGLTMSRHFPTTPGAFQTASTGGSAGFVSKLNPGGTALVYSTLLGGTGQSSDICIPVDSASGIVLDASGNAYVAGFTGSSDFPIPVTSATLEPVCQNLPALFGPQCQAGFVTVISPTGASLSFSSFLGGYTGAALAGIAMDGTGKIYVTGQGTLPAVGGSQTTGRAILAKIDINGSAPAAALLPLTLSLGTVGTGATTPAQAITLTNRGNGALTVTNISITGTPATGSFTQSNNCPASLPPAGSCTINVSFTASALGASTGNLTVTDSAFDSPQFSTLAGAGGTVGATTNTSSLGFGNQTIGSTSAAQSVTLSSTGDAILSISSISVNGDFAETNNCGSFLAAGSSCSLNVTFTPTTSGTRSSNLTITSNAPSSPQTILLGGSGVASLGLTTPSGGSSSATVQAGGPASYTLAIGGGGMSGTASLACTGAPMGAVCTAPSTIPVAAAAASTFTVNVTTTSRTLSAFRLIENHPGSWAWAVFFLGIAIRPRAQRRKRALLRLAWLMPLVVSLSACSGGGGSSTNPNGTPAGTYTLKVTATSGATSQSVNLTLIVQ